MSNSIPSPSTPCSPPPRSHMARPPSTSPFRSSSPPMTPTSSHSTYLPAYIHDSSPNHYAIEESVFSTRYRQTYPNNVLQQDSALFTSSRRESAALMKSPPLAHCFSAVIRLDQIRHSSPDADLDNDNESILAARNARSTFFMVSAERGRWKTDPMPRKTSWLPKSDLTNQPPFVPPQRVPTSSASQVAPIQEPRHDTSPAHASRESEDIPPTTDSSHILPSLTADGEDCDDQDEPPTPLSPLPPSSPPLSPLSSYSSARLQSDLSPTASPLLLSSPLSSSVSEHLLLDESPQDSMASGTPYMDVNKVMSADESTTSVKPEASHAPTKAVLGPRENLVSEARLHVRGAAPAKKKRKKEDQPGPELTKKKKRRIQGSSSQPHPNSSTRRVTPREKPSVPLPPPCGLPREPVLSSTSQQEADEICGMLIESMALSRASSLPLSSLYKSVMQTQPALKAKRSEKEWEPIFWHVLESGRETGAFGKVESSGKDDRDRPLEARWFYVPEMDEDQERAALIKNMMPRPAKRNETKKYKQYYYRPLDKLSRWDPEESL